MPNTRKLTYCSFATQDTCLGVVLLEGALTPLEASIKAHQLHINPGGELLSVPCTEVDGNVPPSIFEAMWDNRNRIIPAAEARTLFDACSLAELEAERNAEELL